MIQVQLTKPDFDHDTIMSILHTQSSFTVILWVPLTIYIRHSVFSLKCLFNLCTVKRKSRMKIQLTFNRHTDIHCSWVSCWVSAICVGCEFFSLCVSVLLSFLFSILALVTSFFTPLQQFQFTQGGWIVALNYNECLGYY